MPVDFRDTNAVIAAVRPLARPAVTRKSNASRARFAAFLENEPDFELEEEEIPVTEAILRRKMSLDPVIYMQDLYGDAYNPVTGQVNHNDFMEKTQNKTEELSHSLKKQLDLAGVDTRTAIGLQVDESGNVVPAGDSPDAGKIETVFAHNPALAQRFRDVAQAQHWAALHETAGAYVNTLYSTEDQQKREAISEQFREVFEQLAEVSTEMDLQGGNLNSAAVTVALKALDGE